MWEALIWKRVVVDKKTIIAQMSQRSSYRPYGQASTFMYIFHLISIDLQSSRLLNSPILQRLQL